MFLVEFMKSRESELKKNKWLPSRKYNMNRVYHRSDVSSYYFFGWINRELQSWK